MTARLVPLPGGHPENPGEQAIIARLVHELPSPDYVVLPNVLLRDGAGRQFEYDVIVIAPHAVYTIEIKDWAGEISGDDREWLVGGRHRPAPIGGVEQKAKVLKGVLTDARPVLGRVWVQSVVALAKAPPVLDLSEEARQSVCLPSELTRYVADPAGIRQRPDAIRTLGSTIEDAITRRRSRQAGPVRFGPYQVRELLERDDTEAWYVAFRPEMPLLRDVLLRVVEDSPYLQTQAERDALHQRLHRDMEAVMAAGPHPNVVPVRDVQPVDGAIFAVLDMVGGVSLRRRMAAGPPLTAQERTAIVLGIAEGLQHLHEHGVTHRAVAPSNVLLGHDDRPRLARFDLAKLDSAGHPTVWSLQKADGPYLAPELRMAPHSVSPAADVFSLGVLAWELFAGTLPFTGAPTTALPALPAGLPPALAQLLPRMLRLQPNGRPSAAEVVDQLRPPDERGSRRAPKEEYLPGDVIDDQFEVRTLLGKGGFSAVYRVYRPLDDRDYALKLFRTGDSHDKLQRELTILRDIQHPHVVRVIWGDQTSAGEWYLLCEFVDGESLRAYAYESKWLAPSEVRQVAEELLDALAAIHPDEVRQAELEAISAAGDLTGEQYDELQEVRRGVVHRDVKPDNVLLTPSRGIVLIDFNISSMVGDRVQTVAGTPRYRPPEADLTTWNVATDLYATGVLIYELLTHKHPHDHLAPGDDQDPEDPRRYRADLSPDITAWLLRACARERADRFPTARAMRDALARIGELIVPPAPPAPPPNPNTPNTNPFVAQLLEMGSQARRSNAGTRGLTDVARQTYVETALDHELRGPIAAGRHQLVIVTGNAGDGKTAFIQRLEASLLDGGATRVRQGSNGSEIDLGARRLVTLYDGSQDEDDRSSDEVLEDFFRGVLSTSGRSAIGIIAVNEGRLRDFLHTHAEELPRLVHLVAELDEPGSLHGDEVVLVNLNLRSITAGGVGSIVSRQLTMIATSPAWGACVGCDWRATCPIKHNVETFADPSSGPVLVERVRRLLDVVRLRRRRHLTLRDLRSLIAFLLLRDRSCEEIGELAADPEGDPYALLDLVYSQAMGALGAPPESAVDRGIELLREFDVADHTNPDLDRALALDQGPRRLGFDGRTSDLGAALIERARAGLPVGPTTTPEAHRRYHAAHRRHVFFERADDRWQQMLPYRQLERFSVAFSEPDVRAELKLDVIQAISRSEGSASDGGTVTELRLTSGRGAAGVRAFRRYPVAAFELRVPEVRARYVEAESDRLELVHLPSSTTLPVDLDLLEMLERLRQGHVASAEERRGFMLNLMLFKNRLLVEPARELVLEHGAETFRVARRREGAIGLEVGG